MGACQCIKPTPPPPPSTPTTTTTQSLIALNPKINLKPATLSTTKNTTSTSTTITTTNNNSDKNRLIQSLCKKGNLRQALDLLTIEQNPSQQTYELLLLTCMHKNSLLDAVHVHRHLIFNGFDQGPFLATKLINMYEDARKVFDKTRKRTIYVYNALFRALTLAGSGDEVFDLYRKINFEGLVSDRFTYTYVLKACVVSDYGLLYRGKEIHAHIMRHGYGSYVHIMTTLIDMYAKFGCVGFASDVSNGMEVKNVVSWSAMIACYARNSKFEAF